MRTYPNKERISNNPVTRRTYNKIRECFRAHYIEQRFSKPLHPKEAEFLQWIKKYLNEMEENLTI